MANHIVDACCLINLYASDKVEAIVRACGEDFHVSEQVRAEALSFRQPDPDDASLLVSTPIDLSAAVAKQLFKECRFESASELSQFVRFAAELDDGEASCLAIALSRNWLVATDDRKAMRLASESGIVAVTTPELVQRWVQCAQPPEGEIVGVIRRIQRFAKFRPRQSSPLYEWWMKLADAGR